MHQHKKAKVAPPSPGPEQFGRGTHGVPLLQMWGWDPR